MFDLILSQSSLVSLYNHLCQFKSKNIFQIPIALQRKNIVDIQAAISLKDRRFDEKGATKSTTAVTITEFQFRKFSAARNTISLVISLP